MRPFYSNKERKNNFLLRSFQKYIFGTPFSKIFWRTSKKHLFFDRIFGTSKCFFGAKRKPQGDTLTPFMLYVLNTNLHTRKKLFTALTEIYGLGKHTCLQLCDLLGVSGDRRLKQLSPVQIEHLTQLVTQNYNTGGEMKRSTIKNIQRLIKIASYRGFRHTEGLPLRGQRTHGNSRTRRKLKTTS